MSIEETLNKTRTDYNQNTQVMMWVDQIKIEVEQLRANIDQSAKDHCALVERYYEQRKEIERLKGMKPASFDAAIPPGVLPRYMVRWNSPTEPLAVLGDDGYWTPFHAANAEIERLREALKMAGTADENLLCDNGYTLGYVVKSALDVSGLTREERNV